MAFINGQYKNKNISIEVLELEENEIENRETNELMITIESDYSEWLQLSEFRDLAKWMLEKADFIEKNFTQQGQKKFL